jgi:WD40 repeat protein
MDTLEIVKVYNFGAVVWEAVFSKDQKLIGVAGAQNNVHILNGLTLALISTLNTNHNNIVFDLDFRYDSQCLITCGNDQNTKIWNTTDWSLINTDNNKHICYSVEYADNNWYVVAGQHYYETYDTNFTRNYQLHDNSIMDFLGLRIRPGGQYLIATNSNGNLYSADMIGNNTIVADAFPNSLYSCGYSRDSSYFATAG